MFELENPFSSVVPATSCSRCFDTGIWLTPLRNVTTCPNITIGKDHAEPNEASQMLRRALDRLSAQKAIINSQTFDLARILTIYVSYNPCPRSLLTEVFYADTNLTEANKLRKFHSIIEELQKVWLLPVGARKHEPSGYWIITDLEDFKGWINHAKSAPITRLTTIHRVAKHNFPIFAKQFEIEFRQELETEESADVL